MIKIVLFQYFIQLQKNDIYLEIDFSVFISSLPKLFRERDRQKQKVYIEIDIDGDMLQVERDINSQIDSRKKS